MADYRNSGGKRELFRCMKLDSSAARCRRVTTLTSHIWKKSSRLSALCAGPSPRYPDVKECTAHSRG